MERNITFEQFYSFIAGIVESDLQEHHDTTLPKEQIDDIVQKSISSLWDVVSENIEQKLY